MHLSEVEVRNFRSLLSLRVALQPGLNVLVGRNNTGKTNLLQAIRHAIGPAGSTGDAIWLTRDDFYRESPLDETDRTIQIQLTWSGLTEGERAHFFEIVDFDLANMDESRAVIRYEATWPKGKRQPSIKRSGGPPQADPTEVPASILESLPVTYLPALRDATASLAPGRRSRLAQLLESLDQHLGGVTRESIVQVFAKANESLETDKMVAGVRRSLQATTRHIAGTDYEESAIRATEAQFEKILRNLQVQMTGQPIESLEANGLGYNNILYIAVILEYLKTSEPGESALLLVEEPESHLHPQLTALLADYLANKTPGMSVPQTVVTTHSPTLAANVSPSQVTLLYHNASTREPACHSVASAGLEQSEERQLQRMMDITRATLYFAKGVILVEGICESLLFPVLARRLGHDLSSLHVTVMPICGVSFGTFKKLLHPAMLGIPTSIVSDGDPPVTRGGSWEEDEFETSDDVPVVSARTSKLKELFRDAPTVSVHHSTVTLEYDLAEADSRNAQVMAEVWEDQFQGEPGTFNRRRVEQAGSNTKARAMCAWRGICRAAHAGSKAEFAHMLAAHLGETRDDGSFKVAFAVPQYIRQAVSFVVDRVPKPIAEGSPEANGNAPDESDDSPSPTPDG
ncbi:MAG: AAA family ATPase [Dehalococcoidia bacterium]|nr:AAA family ATPase [Dehalococcoidia bacterium]